MKTESKIQVRRLETRTRKCRKPCSALVVSTSDRLLRKAVLAELRPGLERETQLMPWLIAETVCDEVSQFLGVDLPVRYAVWLEGKAELCYSRHRRFHKLMRGRGNAPRDWLYAFMRHWLGSILQLERPDLCWRLPLSFAYGRRLPRGTDPGVKKLEVHQGYLPAPRGWEPSRVTRHRAWAWVARIGSPDVAEPHRRPERQIDALVHELYGLTTKKIKLAEGKS